MGFCDYKAQTLELIGKPVSLFLKETSEFFLKYHGRMEGILVGRQWGERISEESAYETVIAVRLLTDHGIEEIPCDEISFIIATTQENAK